ncbi:hypothetical protein pb186bvf_005368 [Paramecium bursaria]
MLKRKKKKSFDETTSDVILNKIIIYEITNRRCQQNVRMLGTGKEFPHPLRISKTHGQSNKQKAKTPSDHNYSSDDSPKQQQFNGVFRKVSSPKAITQERESFSDRWKNLPKMYYQLFGQKLSDYESQESQKSTSKWIQCSIQRYLKKRDEELVDGTKITSDASLIINSIKMINGIRNKQKQKLMTNSYPIHQVYIKQQSDPQLSDKQDEYWQENKKGRTLYQMDLKKKSKFKHKRLAQIFSEQVGYKIAKMKNTNQIQQFPLIQQLRGLFQKSILKRRFLYFLKTVQKNDIEFALLMLNRDYAFDENGNFQTGFIYVLGEFVMRWLICFQEMELIEMKLIYIKEYHYLVGLLLNYYASPWQFYDCKFETKKNVAIQISQDVKKGIFCKKLQQMEILKFLTPYRDRDTLWNQFKGQFLS